jgi:hypothetical protein
MPTENRSSTTDKSTELSACPFCGQQDAFVEQLDSDASVVICQGRIDEYSACLARGPVGVQQDECENQPGHDQAVKEWNNRAAEKPHPEPIAWMVGTAIWWVKEEAERDAAATGLPVVPVGPMFDTGEVERQKSRADTNALNHRHAKNAIGDIKAYVERLVAASNGQPSVATGYLSDIVTFIVERTKVDPTETSDINALRLELQESRRNEFNACAQLAERDALLTDIEKRHWSGVDFDLPADLVTRIKAISVSAEPEAMS